MSSYEVYIKNRLSGESWHFGTTAVSQGQAAANAMYRLALIKGKKPSHFFAEEKRRRERGHPRYDIVVKESLKQEVERVSQPSPAPQEPAKTKPEPKVKQLELFSSRQWVRGFLKRRLTR